jgi:hypothetical protein
VVFKLVLINLVHVFHCAAVNALFSVQVFHLLQVKLVAMLYYVNNFRLKLQVVDQRIFFEKILVKRWRKRLNWLRKCMERILPFVFVLLCRLR